MPASASRGIFYGWVIVLVSFLTLALVMGTRFCFGVFYTSILNDMGWGRASTAGIFSVSMLVYAVVASGVGAAFDWLGPRRLFPLAAVLLGLGFFLCSMLVPTVLIPVILIWHRSSPEDLGLHPDGASQPQTADRSLHRTSLPTTDTPYPAALRTRAFWALFVTIFTIAFNLMLLIVHQNQYLVDIGFSQEFAAWMLGMSGLLRSGGSILWGYLSDRTTRETSFTISTLLGVVALPFLLSAQTSPEAWRVVLFVVLMGLGYGGTSVIYGTSAADLFQGQHFGKILGIMEIGFGLGASLGSYLAGFVFDHFQTYRPSFYIIMVLMLVSIGCIWIAAPRTARFRDRHGVKTLRRVPQPPDTRQ